MIILEKRNSTNAAPFLFPIMEDSSLASLFSLLSLFFTERTNEICLPSISIVRMIFTRRLRSSVEFVMIPNFNQCFHSFFKGNTLYFLYQGSNSNIQWIFPYIVPPCQNNFICKVEWAS